jgi:AraC-like DNA-binding protein
MTSVMWVRNLIAALDACGLDGTHLARQAGIKQETLEVLESGVWVSEIIRLWELAIEASGNQAIGLLAAQTFRPSSVGVLGYSMMASPSLHEALLRGIRFSGAVTTATTASLTRIDEGYRFAFHIMTGVIDVQRQNHEYVVSSFLQFFRWMAGRDLRPIRVEFMHPRPSDLAAYRDFFDCPVAFGSADSALVLSEHDLRRPLLTSNPLLTGMLDLAAEQQIIKMGQAMMTQRVRQLIVQSLPCGEPTRDDIAKLIGISSRSLQRRLVEEKQSFHQLLEDIRHNLAERYLARHDIRLADIAGLLGFSDQSSFTRAAHRWFDASPSRIRSELLARRQGN